ncbi:MAG: carboxypeptidase-like regulatory domain-containing protein, partial [Muribaculaceae bacterium]|nr:carboxypeptidase-like regulatory domain-containing protein [Muribaculaceae bacterium]
MRILFIIYTSLACLLLSPEVFADNVRISGNVRDSENKPVEFGTVRIDGTSIGTNTDLNGHYTLTVAEKDTINVVFSCIGFKTVTHRLIKPKGDLTLNVKMYPDDYMLSEVEVTSFRDNINGMQSFSAESFKLSPDVSGGSIESMISTFAGVNSSNEMSSQYSV